MAIYTAPVADGTNTKWNTFKNDVKSGLNYLYHRYDVDDFVREWAKPAIHDAKALGSGLLSKADNYVSNNLLGITHDAKETVANAAPSSGNFSPGASSSGASYSSVQPAVHSAATQQQLNYLHADLAAHYGMDTKAAYSEALQNTAYQRAVADLKRAGLNPVLAANGLAPAGSYAAGNTLSGGSGSGSSGGSGSGRTGKYAYDPNEYNLIGITGQVVGAIAGIAMSPKAPVLGASTGAMLGKQLAQSYAQAQSSLRK